MKPIIMEIPARGAATQERLRAVLRAVGVLRVVTALGELVLLVVLLGAGAYGTAAIVVVLAVLTLVTSYVGEAVVIAVQATSE